jgi:hypothetical protein
LKRACGGWRTAEAEEGVYFWIKLQFTDSCTKS